MDKTTVIFDLGGVLVWTRWENFCKPLGLAAGLDSQSVMQKLIEGDAYNPFMRGEFGAPEFCRRLRSQFGIDWPDSLITEAWQSIIEPHAEIAGVIESLAKSYRLVMGSNTDVLHYAAGINVQPALEHFDGAILSCEVGALKPDEAFFKRGADLLRLNVEECLFTDDRPENVAAANASGIAAFQFKSVASLKLDLLYHGIRV